MKRVTHPQDYVEETGTDGKKSIRYVGPMYCVDWGGLRERRVARLWMIAAALFAVWLVLGFLPVSDDRLITTIPFIVSFWPTAMIISCVYRISRYDLSITRPAKEGGIDRLRFHAGLGLCVAAMLFVGQAVVVIRYFIRGNAAGWAEWMYLAAVVGFLSLFRAAREIIRKIMLCEMEGSQ